MNKLFTALIFCLLNTTLASAQLPSGWSRMNWGTVWGTDINWANEQDGIICKPFMDYSYYTHDGGTHWIEIPQSSGIAENNIISHAAVMSPTHIVISAGQKIYQSFNGTTFLSQIFTSNHSPIINDVFALDDNNIYAVASNYVYINHTGTNTWTSSGIEGSGSHIAEKIAFGTPLNGCLGTHDGRIYYTTDSGSHWIRATAPSALSAQFKVTSVCFRNTTEVFATAHTETTIDSSLILRSVNAGQTWTLVHVALNENLKDIAFRTPDTAYAVGRGYYPGIIYQSNNGGLTWTELFFDYPSCELDDITFLNSELGWIAAYGCVYKFDRRTISSVEDELSGANTATLYPNPATSHLFINSTGTEIEQVNIYNTTGSLVVAVSPLSLGEGQGLRNHQLSIINLPTGVYIAEIKTNEAVVKKRWVKM